jgi:hypothetical protein
MHAARHHAIQYSGHQIVPSGTDFGLRDWSASRAYSSEEMPMENPTKEQIIHRAYQLWEQAGKPEGRDQEFYHQAEEELKGAQAAPAETPEGV